MQLPLAFRAFIDEVHEQLAAEGFDDVRPAYGFAFRHLSWHPEGVSGVDLARHLGVTKQAAGQLLDELERRGYVERRPHPTDRRSRVVVLADRGWACVRRFELISAAVEERWSGLVGRDRLDALRADLDVILADAARSRQLTMKPVW